MDPVWLFLLAIAAIFLIGALGEVTFQRTNIPDVIWLILAGIVLGPVAGFVTRAQLDAIAPYFAALTLVIILFESGSALKLSELSRAAPRSMLLAVLSFGSAVTLVAVVSMVAVWLDLLPKSWSWTHGVMLGTILGSSSSVIVVPAMKQARLEAKVPNLVSLESALTDALCVVGTVALIDVLQRGGRGTSEALANSFGIGVGIGGAAGLAWILFLKVLRSREHAYPVTLSALLILYVVIDHFGGSAPLGILVVAVLLGNASSLSKGLGLADVLELDASVRGFHRQMAFIIKSFFFVFIGAMLGPPWSVTAFGVLLGVVLFGARLPSVWLSTLGGDFSRAERQMVSIALPRGMTAGVLAILPVEKGIAGARTLPLVVFSSILVTILIFAVGFPLIRRKMPTAPSEASLSASEAPSVSPLATAPTRYSPPPGQSARRAATANETGTREPDLQPEPDGADPKGNA